MAVAPERLVPVPLANKFHGREARPDLSEDERVWLGGCGSVINVKQKDERATRTKDPLRLGEGLDRVIDVIKAVASENDVDAPADQRQMFRASIEIHTG